MARTKQQMILAGLSGRPINDLIDGWTFYIREVAPYIFKVDAEDIHGQTAFGAGGNAEDALEDCLRQVKKKIAIGNYWAETVKKVRAFLRLEK